jgi:hypothetical protein
LECELPLISCKEIKRMSDTQRQILSRFPVVTAIHTFAESEIVLSSPAEVDSRRMMHALSIPEYIEAWLRASDPEELFVFGAVTHERFHMDLYRAEARRASIHGSARVVSRNQVTYVWKTISATGIAHTAVDFRILEGHGRCIVDLKHSGFHNPADREWHRKMWVRSIDKLCSLMRPTERANKIRLSQAI